MPFPVPTPPALQAPPPTRPQEAEATLLDAFDWGLPLPPAPKLKGTAALEDRWLRAAATFDPALAPPDQPFPAGPARAEAEALRRLLRLPKEQVEKALQALPLRHGGTILALWRWGQRQVRQGAFPPPLRRLWEDRLLQAKLPLVRGYALRHALCWCLAEQDEARFAALRARPDQDADTILAGFQRLFALLGSHSPELRLWTLPGLAYQDLRLDQLGARRIWIHPAPKGPLPALPPDTAWIAPSSSGSLDPREASLTGDSLSEGQSLAERLRLAGLRAHLAPSRAAFEQLSLVWFPILIELNAQGELGSIRMGDAAPERP